MFDCLTTLPHGLRVFVEALLYGLQYILMLPARDAPLHAGGAALLERTVATRICPIAPQLLPVLLVRIVVLQLFASRTAIRILVAVVTAIGNGFEFIDAEDFLRLGGNVCELRSI